MFSTTDTIVAIATPPGRGGIGVVRLSGPAAQTIAGSLTTTERALEPRHATLTMVRLKADTTPATLEAIDQVVATYFPFPHSYTGEDVVEISAHGSPIVLQSIVEAAIGAGARLAEPGEFTLRAFLNSRIDLTQAEAIADLIDAVTPLQARAAFDQLQGTLTQTIGEIDAALFDLIARLEASVDFPEEGFHFIDRSSLAGDIQRIADRVTTLLADARRGRLVREGLQVAIVGPPNAGKSSLFNALVGAARAIVTDVPGTTRDLVTEVVDVEGLRVTLIDTAGLRDTDDVVESEGVRRSMGAVEVADVVVMVVDQSQPLVAIPRAGAGRKQLVVANKSDLPPAWSRADVMAVSAVTGEGLDVLRRRIIEALDVDLLADRPAITNVRHIALLDRALGELTSAHAATARDASLSEEFILADLQRARGAFEEVTGRRAPDDLLLHIFERFCVGK